MIKKGDKKTFELYERYCKGDLDHFGVKGGKNKDGRVTFVQDLEAYARKAIKSRKYILKNFQERENLQKKRNQEIREL